MTKPNSDQILTAVRERYGAYARSKLQTVPAARATCCGSAAAAEPAPAPAAQCCSGDVAAAPDTAVTPDASCCGDEIPPEGAGSAWADSIYSADDTAGVDRAIAELTLGCGNPIAIGEMQPGETVLDLGSGAGLDCFLSAQQVGPSGRVIGVDMTPEMLALARRNLTKVGAANVEFREGFLEKLPVESDTVDVIISNCVINLSPDKPAVLREAYRVLKPGGRFRVSDIVWRREPTEAERSNLASWAGCVAGALRDAEFATLLTRAGFTDVRIESRADTPHDAPWTGALIFATKP